MIGKLRLVYRTASTAVAWTSMTRLRVNPDGYIFTAGANSGGNPAYLGAWTYAPSTNVITLVQTGSTTSGAQGFLGMDCNYRGAAITFYSNDYGVRVYTFNGTTLTVKASNKYLVGSPKLDYDVAFRVGTNSDDMIIAQNSDGGLGRVVSFTWDGSTTITNGVLKTAGLGAYSRKICANSNYFVVTGYQTVSYWGSFSSSVITMKGNFGDQDSRPFISPYINRVYSTEISTYARVTDINETAATHVTYLSPGLGAINSYFEDSNNIVYLCGALGIAAYSYTGSTYTLLATIPAPNGTTFYSMHGDSSNNLFAISSNKKVYVIRSQWYTPNPLVGLHI